jgi:VWFA-related protein
VRIVVGALIVVASIGAAAQQAPPVFRGGTDLVEVDVLVHDKSGGFVRDLSADDFIVEDTGQPQVIQQFYLHGAGSAAQPPGAAPLAPGDQLPTSESARTFVVVFDDAHLTPGGFKRTQSAAQMLFTREFRSGDLGGIVAEGRMVNGRLTTDRDELLKAIREARPSSSKNSRFLFENEWPRLSESEAVRLVFDSDRTVLEEAIRRACSDDPPLCRKIDPEPAVRSKASQLAQSAQANSALTLQTLRALAEGLGKLQGRKTILLMSEGFIAEESWPLVRNVVALAAHANARFYTLDARGLERGLISIAKAAPTGDDANARMLEQMEFGADSMNSLAVDTGGFIVRNTNQFDKAIARIGDDMKTYYVLGYRPTVAQDGKFHDIKVRVKRPGVAVRARRGYVAIPRAPATTAAAVAAAAITAAPVPRESLSETAVPVVVATAIPAVEATPVLTVEPTSRVHGRPGAEANALRLAPSDKKDPDATDGWSAYQQGDVETAHARLAAAAGRPEAQIWVHYTLGLASYALARYREAADAWERVRNGADRFEPVYFDLIDAYVQLKEHDRAIRTARDALTRWPEDAEIFQALGVVQTVRGSLDDAVKAFQSAAAIAPDDANVYFNLGKAMELRYYRSRRYVNQLGKWVSNERDRTAAIANYERHVNLGGVYADSARAGLARLNWVPKPQ